MSGENLSQVYAANPITTNQSNDLMYFVRSTIDYGMKYSDFAAQFPGLTGTGASGTWGINISGNAATATSASSASAVALSGITGLGTGVATALGINIGSAGAPVLFNGAGGTPSSMVGTNITGTAAGLTAGVASAVAVGGITGLGTGVGAALAVNVGSAGAPVLFNGAGGTPSSMTATNLTGTAAGLTAGTASAVAVGGITGLGTGVATALAINVGSAGAFVTFNGAGGTPSSMVGTNITGTAAGLTAGVASAVAVGGITGLGTGVATALAANVTGSGSIVLANAPTFVTGTVTAPSITFSSTSGTIGTTTNNNAAAGSVGEFVDSGAIGPVSFTTTDAYQNMTSISLTAGDWDVDFAATIFFTGTVSTNACVGSISTTSATPVGNGVVMGGWYIAVPLSGNPSYPLTGHTRISVGTTTTVYLVGGASWTGTAPVFYCEMTARRVR